jgi:hypothetical protein
MKMMLRLLGEVCGTGQFEIYAIIVLGIGVEVVEIYLVGFYRFVTDGGCCFGVDTGGGAVFDEKVDVF